ncbi:nagb/rpia/CoA transferase-like protein [Auriculariales sp. MPI-PUGE-AT-0066]|nr:nagb/rpia/CoA transferase-like protein [Auriculariales sp. MPI-PUGE-AT-0066]
MSTSTTYTLKHRESEREVEKLCSMLRRRQLLSARQAALATFYVLRNALGKSKFNTYDEALVIVRGVGRRLVAAQPKQYAVGNIARKVIALIREEANGNTKASSSAPMPVMSLASFISSAPSRVESGARKGPVDGLISQSASASLQGSRTTSAQPSDDEEDDEESEKALLMQALSEIQLELEGVHEGVAKNAQTHIHNDEIVLTLGRSQTIEAFLKAANHTRRFTAIVAETAPTFSGRVQAAKLAELGINAVLVPDSAVFALLSRVNKVILPAHAVLATGAMFAPAGSLIVASVAKAHAVPVVACAAQFKMTPRWQPADYAAADLGDPAAVLGLNDVSEVGHDVDVLNPAWDFIEPALVDVYITNDGDHAPSFIHRLIRDAYGDDDTEL